MKIYKTAAAIVALLTFAACQQSGEAPEAAEEAPAAEEAVAEASALDAVLGAQPEEVQARYPYRNPKETIEFFGIEPGMTVVEGLPGRGWYTNVLIPYLGSEGRIVGADYSLEMYPLFSFVNEEFIENQKQWAERFVAGVAVTGGDSAPSAGAFHFGSMPDEFAGTADVVFFPRVLHNLARFESEGDFLTKALADAYAILKPGGTFGVVQHQARDEMSDTFADGSRGYLKKSFVISAAEQAGFVLDAESDINANPNDQPGEDDIVWRLPPTLGTSGEDPELRAELEAVGESNRMTLRFKKPE